ncbi:hypothetical protein CEUSTIGMA_g3639.t1 [Chlamydomonas eustigma]|uniref:Dynein regulatory complex subunit 5 n=1 Tax=Chlamydomonas eustigma TaxID=1157962 RepID=A0A250WZI5_9CHLO|nr:hypothetical protein CEUSTIGMA_g3639.t1 [Chlamydomonas eustigma]|eukprot:GAX76195.1 hypothetical protein CEUSTIGMA_g3639.t1 [Chlamydomonas eustigma]
MNAPFIVPPLKDLCVTVVAGNFEENPTFGPLPDKYVKKVVEILPIDLPLELAGTAIIDEEYWKRRCLSRWKNMEAAPHAGSWKQLYFEKNLEDAMEQYDAALNNMDDLKRLMTYSRKFIQTVRLRQLPSHMDLTDMFECMINSPSALAVHYSLKNVGMEYDRSLFGMKLADCRTLAKCLEKSETLTYLDLSNNGLDDDKVRMLASGLVENLSITHLNLSHNKVADRGVRALAKLLDSKSVITMLELQDNQIHVEGAKSLARAFKSNQALVSVNLRLNRMGDEGCKVVCDALKSNNSLERFNLGSNSAGAETVSALVPLIRLSQSLIELDLSCNSFGPKGCEQIRKAVEQNTTLQIMDIRQCGAELDEESAISENLRARQEKRDRAKIVGRA